MQANKEHPYVVELKTANAEGPTQAVSFAITNHDDIFQKMQVVAGTLAVSSDEEKAFLLGLKMFSEVILQNRHKPPFAEMFIHMKSVMQLLKSHIKQKSSTN